MTQEIENNQLYISLKWALKSRVIEGYKASYFKENGKEPSVKEVNIIRSLLDEKEMDDIISASVKSHMEELLTQAKNAENKNPGTGYKDKIIGGGIASLLASGIVWRLSVNDIPTSIFLGFILVLIIIYWIKK